MTLLHFLLLGLGIVASVAAVVALWGFCSGKVFAACCRRDPGQEAAGTARSPGWRKVEKAHLAKHPGCAVCGATRRCQVHHKVPFHLDRRLELVRANLITLCEDHHLLFGHLGDFKCFNPLVETDATVWRLKLRNRSLTKLKLAAIVARFLPHAKPVAKKPITKRRSKASIKRAVK